MADAFLPVTFAERPIERDDEVAVVHWHPNGDLLGFHSPLGRPDEPIRCALCEGGCRVGAEVQDGG